MRTEGKKERKKIGRDIEAAMTEEERKEKEKIGRDVEEQLAVKTMEEQKEKRTHRQEITPEVTRYI